MAWQESISWQGWEWKRAVGGGVEKRKENKERSVEPHTDPGDCLPDDCFVLSQHGIKQFSSV